MLLKHVSEKDFFNEAWTYELQTIHKNVYVCKLYKEKHLNFFKLLSRRVSFQAP